MLSVFPWSLHVACCLSDCLRLVLQEGVLWDRRGWSIPSPGRQHLPILLQVWLTPKSAPLESWGCAVSNPLCLIIWRRTLFLVNANNDIWINVKEYFCWQWNVAMFCTSSSPKVTLPYRSVIYFYHYYSPPEHFLSTAAAIVLPLFKNSWIAWFLYSEVLFKERSTFSHEPSSVFTTSKSVNILDPCDTIAKVPTDLHSIVRLWHALNIYQARQCVPFINTTKLLSLSFSIINFSGLHQNIFCGRRNQNLFTYCVASLRNLCIPNTSERNHLAGPYFGEIYSWKEQACKHQVMQITCYTYVFLARFSFIPFICLFLDLISFVTIWSSYGSLEREKTYADLSLYISCQSDSQLCTGLSIM